MKTFYLHLIIILLFIGCRNAADKKIVHDDNQGISIHKCENMSIGNDECYYAIYNGDTLNLFCDFTTVPQMNFMNIDFRDVNNIAISSDSVIFSTEDEEIKLKRTTYNQQLFLISNYLKRIASEKNIRKLKHIGFPLFTSGSLNIEISNMLAKRININEAVKKSSIFSKMNMILKEYGLEVSDVFIDKYVLVGKQDFIDHNRMDSLPNLKNTKFIDCDVGFKIKPIND